MSKVKIHIDIGIKFYNEFFIGGGKGNSILDSYILKDIYGIPYIPGSAIKGKLRYLTTGIFNNLYKEKCHFYYNNNNECDCLMCRLFGSKDNKKGVLNFQNLNMQNYEDLQRDNVLKKNIVNTRVGIQINRYLKNVNDQSLFKYESGNSLCEKFFIGEIDGYLESSEYKKQLMSLFLGFGNMETIGGYQSRGLGWIDDERKFDIYVNNALVTSEILKEWRDELEV